jgi:enediyne biosynthesis protein E4
MTPQMIIGSLAVSALICGAGCGPNPSPENPDRHNPAGTVEVAQKSEPRVVGSTPFHFADASAESGVDWRYWNGEEAGEFAILESLGGGVAALDFDRDGDDDLLFPGGGQLGNRVVTGRPGGLYRNGGKFEFEAVTASAGVEAVGRYSHGAFAADADNDGFPEVLITGYGGVQYWRNLGDGTLVEAGEASGLIDPSWSSAAAWGDLTGDGTPDVYVAHYVDWSFDRHPACEAPPPHAREVCPPRRFAPLPDSLFVAQGDGQFTEASAMVGLRGDGKGLGVLLADLDCDGDSDIYVTNDTEENFLYVNLGAGRLEDFSLPSGAALSDRGVPDGSMGLDLCDFNQDGLPDLFVANYESENCALYENLGQNLFRHVSQRTGISASGGMFVGWGTLSNDLDLDGDEDFVVMNSHVLRFPTNSTLRQPPLLYENLGNGRFVDQAPATGGVFSRGMLTRGLAGSDLNRDGAFDLVAVPLNEPVLVVANTQPGGRGWIEIDLVGTTAARDPVGARVAVTTVSRAASGGKWTSSTQTRQFRGGGSYLSTHSRWLHWGLGEAESIDRIEVIWPGGGRQTLGPVPTNHAIVVVENGGGHVLSQAHLR